MSPPVITPTPAFEIPKSDCPSTQTLESCESFNFSAGSAYASGFGPRDGTEKSHIPIRSRPRLTKMRRKQMPAFQDGKTVKTDLGLNGVSDVSGKKNGNLGNAFGVTNRNLGSNGSAMGIDLNGNVEGLGSGLVFGVSLNDSLFGLGSGYGNSLFGSSVNSSTNQSQSKESNCSFPSNESNFDVQKKATIFVFGAHTADPTMKQNLPGKGFVNVPNKNGLQMNANLESGQFVFGVGDCGSSWKTNVSEKDCGGNLGQPKVGDFQKSDNIQFVFGSDYVVDSDKCKPDKVSGSTIPDVRGKVKLDIFAGSEKVHSNCFQFSFDLSDSSSKNYSSSKSAVDLENKSTGKVRDMLGFTDKGKENAGLQSDNACPNGVFVFGGLKGKGSLYSGGSSKPFSEMNQLNRGNVDGCNGFEQHNHDSFSDTNSKLQNSGSSAYSFETDPAFSILNEMRRLNISDPEVDAKKSGNFTGKFKVDSNNAFVFGGEQKKSDIGKDNHPSLSKKTPDVNGFSHNDSISDKTSSSFLPSAGIGVKLNGGFCEVPSTNKDKEDSADYCTPNMKFDFSKSNVLPGVEKLDSTTLRSLRGKKSKNRNGKLRQRTVVQQLFSQNHVSKEGHSEQNQMSPGSGSPMDFSPYRDTSASNAPESDTVTGDEKHTSEHCEKPCDDWNTISPSLPRDGLADIRRQYKKKYKLKVGSNPMAQRNSPDKENAKQEPSGTTSLEVCEHWRIRGNEAYHAGQLSKAEEFYSMGINSVPQVSITGYSIKPLILCYSNRAATLMSLGRMREALGDCKKASEVDPNFLKATLRAGNCYLVLGEVDDAIQCYNKCSAVGTSICLDRRITIEAADGLQKAKKVAEHILQSNKVLQEGTEDAANRALGIIEEALSISRYSERLLELKGEALHMLRMYDEVILLCEQTLDVSRKNFSADLVNLWRWHLQTKSYFRLGKLDLALELIEKQEKLPNSSRTVYITQESSIALAANIRELLSLKNSGNEAFNSGRYTEAVEHYTGAISKSFESRGFMAICFCNRAAAYQSLSQIVDAISDCSVAIALDEKYIKAISRRATLHEMIRDYKQAVCDLERLVSLLESRSQIKTQGKSSGGSVRDLRKARRRLSSAEEKSKNETPLDFYIILGIKASDSESEIKKAYRKAALRHHPDKAGQVLARNDAGDDGTLRKEFGEKIHEDADRLFKIIGEAYAVLSNPSKRSKYDDEEEIRKMRRECARSSNSGHPSTSYSSPFERGSWSGKQSGFNASCDRNNSSRRYWYDARSYSYSQSRW